MQNLLKKLPFYNQPWFNFLRFLTRHYLEDECQQKAASLTYTTLLSIVPIITILLMILSSVNAFEPVREQIYQMIYDNLLPSSSGQVRSYINDFAEKSTNLTAIGIMALFITTVMTLTTIERAFNKIWRVENRSGGMKSAMRYLTIIILGPFVLGTAFALSSTIQSLDFLNRSVGGYGIDWQFWLQLVSYAITVAGFVAMYWFLPKAKVPIKNAAIAGVIVAIVFELLKNVFGIIMTNFTSYEAVYGAFAALPIFLLWIYLSWNIILIGVEISYTLTIFKTKEVYPRHPLLSLLDMLNLVYDRHQIGADVGEQELRDVLGRKEMPKWYTYLNYLKDSNLIAVTDEERFVLKRDLTNMTLWDFYKTLPYPLPIKNELDTLDMKDAQPWLNVLIERFIRTENYAADQLHLSLDDILSNSKPRKEVEADFSDGLDNDKRFESEDYDRSARVAEDNEERKAIIPLNKDNTGQHNSSDSYNDYATHSASSSSKGNPIKVYGGNNSTRRNYDNNNSDNNDSPTSTKRDKLLITEDDNPNPS